MAMNTRLSFAIACKCLGLAGLVFISNTGVLARVTFTLSDGRYLTSAIFVTLWTLSLVSLLAAAFQPTLRWRLFWAVPIAAASAFAFGFYRVQSKEFFVFDLLSLWEARHEIGRAVDFYRAAAEQAALLFLAGVAIIAAPPVPQGTWLRAWLHRVVWLPTLPVLLIAGVVVYRDGKGSENLSKQFSPLSLAAVAAVKLSSSESVARRPLTATPSPRLVNAIVLFVDESVRADRVSLEPGNRFTPELARERERWVDFGPSAATGNCSHIANAQLRFMADPRQLVHTARTNPTVWQYAKRAGYRTVYIDAQAGFIRIYGKLQNYMTLSETAWIDRLYKLDETIPTHALDDELLRIVLEELREGGPVFIYANKNGAHFPYRNNYPPNHPSLAPVTPAGADERVAEYDAAIRWSTDRVLAAFTRKADLRDAVALYTSDHGQHFHPGRLTHCASGGNVHPEEGIVPLLVSTGQRGLEERFRRVAAAGAGLGTGFAIAPTLLELMGYDDEARQSSVGSLLSGLSWKPSFVSDDIFGLFRSDPVWHPVDLTRRPAGQAAARISRGLASHESTASD